ncbi:MAG: hypothetical protein RRY35_05035 [Clostridiales bacterium]
MILYAVKYQNHYLRDKKELGVALLPMDHCSVYTNDVDAKKLADKFAKPGTILIQFTLQEKEIPWPIILHG